MAQHSCILPRGVSGLETQVLVVTSLEGPCEEGSMLVGSPHLPFILFIIIGNYYYYYYYYYCLFIYFLNSLILLIFSTIVYVFIFYLFTY